MKKYKNLNTGVTIAIFLLLLTCLIFGCIYIADSGEEVHNCYEEAFGKEIYAELKQTPSTKHKKELEPIMEEVEEALNFIGTKKEAKEKFGILSRYSNSNRNTSRVEADVEFLTAKLYTDTGYMWIKYSQEVFNRKGNGVYGSADIESRITLVKFNDGQWKAVNIKEGP